MTHGMDQFNIDGYRYTLKYLQIDAHIQAIMYTYSSLYFQLREPNSNDIRTLISILMYVYFIFTHILLLLLSHFSRV